MPRIVLDKCDIGPDDLPEQLPLGGELIRVLEGPDRPDYCLVRPERAIAFRPPAGFDLSKVRPDLIGGLLGFEGQLVRVPALIVAARMLHEQIQPSSRNLPVGLAYVIDPSQIQDSRLSFEKIHYAAIVELTITEP